MNHPFLSQIPIIPDWSERYQSIIDAHPFNLALANKRNPDGWQQSTAEIYSEVERQFPPVEHPEFYAPIVEGGPKPVSTLVSRIRFPQ